jgi:hypothetical protein
MTKNPAAACSSLDRLIALRTFSLPAFAGAD